jgi:hypothetical protein
MRASKGTGKVRVFAGIVATVFMHLGDWYTVSLVYHVQFKAYSCLRQSPGTSAQAETVRSA